MTDEMKYRLIILSALGLLLLAWAGIDGGVLGVLAVALGICGGTYVGRRL